MSLHALNVSTLLLFAAGSVSASAKGLDPVHVDAPDLRVGDTWSFDQREERGTADFKEQRTDLKIERKLDDTMIVGVKISDAPGNFEDHVIGTDWSMRRVLLDNRS